MVAKSCHKDEGETIRKNRKNLVIHGTKRLLIALRYANKELNATRGVWRHKCEHITDDPNHMPTQNWYHGMAHGIPDLILHVHGVEVVLEDLRGHSRGHAELHRRRCVRACCGHFLLIKPNTKHPTVTRAGARKNSKQTNQKHRRWR